MNFLQLCQRVNAEAGLSGPGPTAVGGQTGMNAKVVNWVLAAHQEIQERHQDWTFDWVPVSKPLVLDKDRYAPEADWGLKVRSWDLQSAWVWPTVGGRVMRTDLVYLPYAQFRDLPVGQPAGQPLYWTVAPDKAVQFYPVPADGLTWEAQCWLRPQVLAGNTDVPRMPEDYHLAIVWRALMLYCGHDESPALWKEAQGNFNRLMGRMEATELPDMLDSETLA